MPTPTDQEQLMLELVNRLRADPAGEAARLAGPGAQANVLSANNYFGVNVAAFSQQMAQFSAVAPLAWNDDLSEAAQYHNQQMIAADQQSHQVAGEPGLGQRALNAGYNYQALAENIYAYTEDMVQGHAGFVIDWGYDAEDFSNATTLATDWRTRGDGMQDPPGHRQNLLNSTYTEIGIAVTAESNPATSVGPLLVTEDLGRSQGYQPKFLGVAIDDRDGDDFYDIGEGLGSVSVVLHGAGGASYQTTSWSSGGWQVAAPAGTYRIVFTGAELDAPVSRIARLGTSNVKLDIEVADEHALHDVNGDGFSDILWRRSDGLLTDWLSNGSSHAGNGALSLTVSADWKLASDGDYNGDGRVDLLWRNDSGQVTNWLSNGNGFIANSAFSQFVSSDYQIAASADFNGDSRDDILWRRSDGFTTDWLSTGSSFNGATGLQLVVGTEWRIAGAADFNGDGLDDILWQRSDSLVATWLSTGTGFNGAGGPGLMPGAGWSVSETGDFNGDGLEDLLLRHTDGRVAAWRAGENGAFTPLGSTLAVSNDWQIEGLGDVNGDSRDDIIWRHADGALTHWLSTGTGFNGAGTPIYAVPLDWDVVI